MNSLTPPFRTCLYCAYYIATEYGGKCCPACVIDHRESQAKQRLERQEQKARDIAEQEAARVLAEQRKKDFDQMAANSTRKPGISYADILKNKKTIQ